MLEILVRKGTQQDQTLLREQIWLTKYHHLESQYSSHQAPTGLTCLSKPLIYRFSLIFAVANFYIF